MFQPSRSPALIAPRHTLLLAQSRLAARDDQALASDRCPDWWKGPLDINRTDVVQALAGQTGEAQLASRLQVGRAPLDPLIQDPPPIVPPIVRRRLISSRPSTWRRRHLW